MPEAGRFPVGPTRPAEIQNSIELARREFIGSTPRQFQIIVNGAGKLTVSEGYLGGPIAYPDSAGDLVWGDAAVPITALTPVTPVTSTNYGFWVEVTVSLPTAKPSLGSGIGLLQVESFSTAAIISSTTYYAGSAADMASLCLASAGKSYFYLGKAAVSGADVITITQNRYGPLVAPAVSYLTSQISSVANNAFRIDASDNKYAVTPVSTDANNQIKVGTDKGAYMKVVAGSGITVTPTVGEPVVINAGVLSVTETTTGVVGVDPTTGDVVITDP